ncbi:hypothetical protein K440DRAFT_644300 [Wilcoxina mikolae CBS 423.85]|nr:hypothetical protein K440DRAFT_644300 [Wilcoxina mikolae CBS 423.85]
MSVTSNHSVERIDKRTAICERCKSTHTGTIRRREKLEKELALVIRKLAEAEGVVPKYSHGDLVEKVWSLELQLEGRNSDQTELRQDLEDALVQVEIFKKLADENRERVTRILRLMEESTGEREENEQHEKGNEIACFSGENRKEFQGWKVQEVKLESLKDLIDLLDLGFRNEDKAATAKRELMRLKYHNCEFSQYYIKFQKYIADVKWKVEANLNALRNGLSKELKDSLEYTDLPENLPQKGSPEDTKEAIRNPIQQSTPHLSPKQHYQTLWPVIMPPLRWISRKSKGRKLHRKNTSSEGKAEFACSVGNQGISQQVVQGS